MSNFRTKLLGLTAVATAFAGMSYGQAITGCTPGTLTGAALTPAGFTPGFLGVPGLNPTLRAEGATELVSDENITGCTNTVATTGAVFGTLSLPVTSKSIVPAGGALGNSDAVLNVLVAGVPAPGSPYYGTVSGSSVSFSNVTFPAGAFSLVLSNVRVNATGGGAPQVTELVTVQYATGGTSSNIPLAAQNVGFILPSLGANQFALIGAGPFTSNSYTTCGGNVIPAGGAGPVTAANLSFTTNIRELVGGAFKTQAQENGSYTPAGANPLGIGLANTADQIVITLANVPASATVYVPQAITATGTTISVANSTAITAPIALVNPAAPAPVPTGAPFVSFTPSSGVVTITYTVTAAASTGAATFPVQTYVIFAANSAAAQGPITMNTAYAPAAAFTGAAPAIPTFAPSTGTALSASAVTVCQTSMLFPFVTNQLGFDTGIVIANTTTDNLGIAGKSLATPSSGTCTLSFYGAGAPTPATGVADPQGATATGTTHAFVLSSVAPGFQGYLIATCPFLNAHGFGFLAYNLTQNNGAVEGYIAEVLNARTSTAAETVTF